MKKLAFFLIAMLMSLNLVAQNVNVSGLVLSAGDEEPLIGASVKVKGTSQGIATDVDGYFSLEVPVGSTVTFDYVGYKGQSIKVTKAMPNIQVKLVEDQTLLDDVVVIGYGTQKKSVVTAAISKVDQKELALTAPTSVENALKGLASGVTVTSASGQPGAGSRVRVRGIGTINNSEPLYIVDGMPIEGGIDYLNPQDIANIEVLKDAASGAVYGARAANGVILVTTKNGVEGRPRFTYDFSYGWQSASRRRNVLNATEYAVMMNEGALNAGIEPTYADPYSYGAGYDWQKNILYDNAPKVNHQFSLAGASKNVNYFFSLGYMEQKGIIGGNYDHSNYNRLTMRSNTIYTVFDDSQERTWLNKLKITANLSYARIKSHGIDVNSQWGSALGSALAISPILRPYLTGEDMQRQLDFYAANTNYVPFYNAAGELLMNPEVFGNYQEMQNPFLIFTLPAGNNHSHKFVGNFIGELQIWDNLVWRTSYGADLSFWDSDGWSRPNLPRSGAGQTYSRASMTMNKGLVWQIENTLSYNKEIGDHTFSILLGQSAKESNSSYLTGWRNDITSYDKPYMNASTGLSSVGKQGADGGPNDPAKLTSYFGRVSYDYAQRYMFQATVRRDGSSRFGSNNHWATFPSFSLGWNIHNEPYMKGILPEWINNIKLRGSWGKNGNENIGNFMYIALANSGNNAAFGKPVLVANGVKPSVLANPDLKWEESRQTDIGLDLGFLSNALTFSVDYYDKRTDGMLMTMQVPSYVGESAPWGNVGKMSNKGVEMDLRYRGTAGDFNYTVGGNLSWVKNELIDYGNAEGWANLDSFQGCGTISRAENGKPFPFFYGLKTDGVIQNAQEAAEYNAMFAAGSTPQSSAVPGDVRFVDINGDGQINDDDRTDIGKGMPDWTYGFNFMLEWKGLALNAYFQGVWGNDIFDATRRTDVYASNLPSWMLDRWTGEGTSNKIPHYVRGDARNWVSSDLYVSDGAYFRLKNIILSYTIPQWITRKVKVENFRVYVSCDNLFTATKYQGYDPEISSGGTSLGIDYGVYPQPRTWTVGFNIEL